MTAADTIALAVGSLTRHRLRTVLTMLGIVIGVAAVVALMALGAGAKAVILSSFDRIGSNLAILSNGSSKSGGAFGGAASLPTLTWQDLAALRKEVEGLELLAVAAQKPAQVVIEGANWSTTAIGAQSDYISVRGWSIAVGRELTREDDSRAAQVAVLGASVVKKLGGSPTDILDQQVRLNGHPLRVIGVLAAKGSAAGGQDQDDTVILPLTTYRRTMAGADLGAFLPGSVYLRLDTRLKAGVILSDVRDLLRQRHRLADDVEDDFSVANLGDITSTVGQVIGYLSLLLASVAGVSLLVGGIGVMNVMLIAVGERTREIGIRIAVGATPVDIRLQFLLEATLLTALGGIVGWGFGALAAWLATLLLSWPLILEPLIVVVAVGTAIGIGIISGFYPALRASRLDPLSALRTE